MDKVSMKSFNETSHKSLRIREIFLNCNQPLLALNLLTQRCPANLHRSFIGQSMQSQIISPLTYHALIQACRLLRHWLDITNGDKTPESVIMATVQATLIKSKSLLEASQVVHTASTLDERPERVLTYQQQLTAARNQLDQDDEIVVVQIALKRVFSALLLYDSERTQYAKAREPIQSILNTDIASCCPRLTLSQTHDTLQNGALLSRRGC